MTAHLEAGFGPLELESMDAAAQKEALSHLDACAGCAESYRGSVEALASLALALPPMTPPPQLRERLLQTVAATSRFDAFAARCARILDVGVEKARAILARIDDAASWSESPLPGVTLYHLDGGPAVANAVVGLVRIAPGHVFPEHTHQGSEVALVLQGSCVEDNGRISRTGDELSMDNGTTHMLTALPGPDFIYLAASQNGFLLFGEHFKPGDLRA